MARYLRMLVYKYLPNACFHNGTKGHFVRDCLVKFPPPPPASTPQTADEPQAPPILEGASFPKPVPHQHAHKPPPSKHKARQANRFALLASLLVWIDCEVAESPASHFDIEDSLQDTLALQVATLDHCPTGKRITHDLNLPGSTQKRGRR